MLGLLKGSICHWKTWLFHCYTTYMVNSSNFSLIMSLKQTAYGLDDYTEQSGYVNTLHI